MLPVDATASYAGVPEWTDGGLAFINSIETLGGFAGPYAVGWLRDTIGSFSAGLMAMAGLLVLATAMSRR